MSRRWGQGRRRNAIVLAIAAVALGAVVWAAAMVVHPRRELQALAVSGMTLQAVDANGQIVWSYAFDRTAVVVEGSRRPDIRRWWRRVDIDADGVDELAAVVAHPNNDGTEPVETLYVFSLDGRLRFRYQPDLDLRFARGRFTGPWLFWDFAVVRQDRSLWLALTHHPWWPSAVVSVDIAGRAAIRFVQPGWIRMLRVYESNGRARVLAAGVNNEHAAASLALLDPAQPAAAAPAPGGTEFTCLNCPTGQPLKYVLLPRSPLNVVNGDPYNYANEVTVSDGLSVITTEAYPSGGMSYELTRDLVVESMRPIDSYWTWSRAQGPPVPWAGRIGHPPTAIVRTWTPAGWTTQTLPYEGLVPSAGDNSTRR